MKDCSDFKMFHLTPCCTMLHILLVFMIVVHHELLKCAIAERVTLMKRPKESVAPKMAWTWTPTGSSGNDQWYNSWSSGDRNLPPQYAVCDPSPSTQPNQWLTSEDIHVHAANRIDITIEYAMLNCSDQYINNNQHCRHNFSLYLHKSATRVSKIPNPYTDLNDFEKVAILIPKVLSFDKLIRSTNKETFSVMKAAAKPYVYLAFHYQGGCVSLFSVRLDYYRCRSISLSSNLIHLPLTTAPGNGSVQVKGSCSQYTKQLTNESDLYGYCKDDGEWSSDLYQGECGCDYGYGTFAAVKGGLECRECPLATYKNTISNSHCTTCPLNSVQDTNRTSCNCKIGFYRTDNQTHFDNCTGIPSAPQNLTINFFNATMVTLTWSAPSENGGRSDLYYTAECKECNDQGEDCTIECTYSDITVNQISKVARIKELSSYTYYQFKVYTKNGVSKLAEKNNEDPKYAQKALRTKETIPGSPEVTVKQLNSTSVYLSWELKKKKGIIKYYVVSYFPVDQPSKFKRFNTTFTTATITGLETGKEYRFQVQASSNVGLGQPSTQTKKVVEDYKFFESSKVDILVPILGAIVALLLLIFAAVVIDYFVKKKIKTNTLLTDQKQAVKFKSTLRNQDNGESFHESVDKPQESRRKETQESYDNLYMVVTDDTLWEIPRENIAIIKRLGSGNFGYVEKALAIGIAGIPGQVTVAVKSLKEDAKDKDKEDFLTELRLMMRMAPHSHVVRLYGCCTKPGGPQSIILEYLPYGDLLGYLRRSRGHEDSYCSGDLRPESHLKSKDLLRFGWMIADGMSFLVENRCVHRDLAARNVLVGENLVCKISDLGLARKLITEDMYTRSTGARLPVKWMPPESLFYGQSTIASDVWAYGIVLWELFTIGDSPYPGFEGKDVPRLLSEGYRMPRPPHLSKTLYSLMLRCWKENPKDRPSFVMICKEINTYLNAGAKDYINLDVFDDSLFFNFDVITP